MRVITCNVNGVRAAARKQGLQTVRDADILCLQEVRADAGQLAVALGEDLTHQYIEFAEGAQKGRNGVAILSRYPLQRVEDQLPGFEEDGRYLRCTAETPLGDLSVLNVYVPKGYATPTNTDDPRDRAKAAFLRELTAALPAAAALLCGDLNIAHTELDLKNWRQRIGHSGFRDSERAVLDHWAERGWTDLTRAVHGAAPGPYTWWSWRGKAFDNDAGWRIDYVWATDDLARRCTGAEVRRAPSYDRRWSDHAPVVVTFT